MLFILLEIPRLVHPCYLGRMGAPEEFKYEISKKKYLNKVVLSTHKQAVLYQNDSIRQQYDLILR